MKYSKFMNNFELNVTKEMCGTVVFSKNFSSLDDASKYVENCCFSTYGVSRKYEDISITCSIFKISFKPSIHRYYKRVAKDKQGERYRYSISQTNIYE